MMKDNEMLYVTLGRNFFTIHWRIAAIGVGTVIKSPAFISQHPLLPPSSLAVPLLASQRQRKVQTGSH